MKRLIFCFIFLLSFPVFAVGEDVTFDGDDVVLPSKLVDIDDENLESGLLPELYLGLRTFFANALVPIFSLAIIFMIFLVIFVIVNALKRAVS